MDDYSDGHYPRPPLHRLVKRRLKRFALWIVVTVCLAVFVGVIWSPPVGVGDRRLKEALVMQALHRDEVLLLVCCTYEQPLFAQIDTSNWWLGRRTGYVMGISHISLGLDLGSVSGSDLSWKGEVLEVQLPPETIIEAAADTGSLKFLISRGGMQVIADRLLERDLREDLLQRIRRDALLQAKNYGALPSRGDLIARLNEQTNDLFHDIGVQVRFK